MSRQGINTGFAPNDGNGDSLLDGAVKINQNFSEIYSTFGDGTNLVSYATIAGYSTSSGVSTSSGYATIAGYSTSSGISTYATSSGISTYATSSGISTYATIAGYSTSSGVSTSSGYATIAGYSTSSGISTDAIKLQTPRTFEITGDIVGAAVTFDGTGNVSIAATIQPNSVGLGTDTTGDYVQSIAGTSNQISVSVTSGEGSAPTLSIPNQFTAPQDVTVTRDLQVNRNLNVNGNITIGGTSASLFSQTLSIFDPDIVLGYRTDAFGNDVSNDSTANHGGVALASTEGTPLVNLFIAGIETNPSTYKKIMWFKSGSFAGLNTDAWLFNYGVGIGSTQVPNGVRLAVGGVQVTDTTVTAATFSGNATTATTAGYATTAGISTVAQGLTGTPSINVYNVGVASAINVGAASTFQKSVHFESTLLIGNTDELQIFNDGSNSYIDNSSAGNLIIRDSGTGIQLKKTSGALMGVFNNDAGVELYYDSVLKFQTFQNGVAINDSVGIGSTAGNPPYRLTVSGVGATITQGLANAIADFTSSVNGYGQVNVRNSLSGTNASGDIVVTANSGNDTSNFIDLGINNAGFTTTSWTINGALDGYLYTSDGNLSIGAAAASKYLSLFAGGTLSANEQVRVTTTGVGIGTTNPTSKLTVTGDVLVSGITTTARLNVGTGGTVITTTVAGSVGIGTTNPTSALTVKGTTSLETLTVTGGLGGYTDIQGGIIAFNSTGSITQTGSQHIHRSSSSGGGSYYFSDYYAATDHKIIYADGAKVELYSSDSKKFETLGVGVTVTGTTFTNQLSVSGVTTTARLNVGTGGTVITTTVAGSVGIGTTNPTNALTIFGNGASISLNDTANNASTTITYNSIILNSTGYIQQTGNTQTFRAGQNGTSSYLFDNYYGGFPHELFYIDTNGSIRAAGDAKITGITTTATFNVGTSGTIITATTAGLVGIGTTNPLQRFQVGAAGNNVVVIDSIGEIGIGTTNPTSKLQVTGDVRISGIITTTTLNVGTGGTVITTTVDGSVGIGITDPQTRLQINGVLGFGNNNIKIGNVSTGSSIAFGSGNFFAGPFAGMFTTDGFNNNFLGNTAGLFNITGSDNNFFGYQSGYNNTTGYSNNFIGGTAGYANTTGLNNNFFGYGAGNANTSGSDNIFIGQATGNANVTGSENVIIGKGRNAPILNGSNQLVIGAGSTSWITGNSSYNIGIGSTTPSRKLDVVDSGVSGSVIRSRVTTNNGGYLAYEALNSSGTSVFSVTHNGRINLSENVVFASGQGLDFSATANPAGMSSELLNDYETGTWTPTVSSTVSAPTVTYTEQLGKYTKIGNIVYCSLSLRFNVTVAGSGLITVSLPYTSATSSSSFDQCTSVGFYFTSPVATTGITVPSNVSTARLLINATTNDGAGTLGGRNFAVNFFYVAA